MSASSATQKDYHPLNNHHAHLNHLKNNINTNSNNGSSASGGNSLGSKVITAATTNGNVLKQRPPSTNLIVDSVKLQQQSTGAAAATTAITTATTTTNAVSSMTTNVAMFVNNNHYHHHHHQHHNHHQHTGNTNNNNNNNTNGNNCNNNNNNSNLNSGNCNGNNSGNLNVNNINNSCNINSTTTSTNNGNNLTNMRKSYTGSDPSNVSFSSASVAGSIQDDMNDQCGLTQAGLEEYNSRSYYDQAVFHHQKQSSYAQSEGYHSYVSSSDSSSATPFLDRLRQESELLSRQSHHWSQNDLSPSANSNSNGSSNMMSDNNSSESTSSTETLKWLGSMSDVSVASHATNSSAISGSVSSSQLIVHSSRVRTPKRHNSESVLYMNDDQMSVTSETSNLNAMNSSCSSSNKTLPQYHHQHQHPHYHPSPLPPPAPAVVKGIELHHHHPPQQHYHQPPQSNAAGNIGGGTGASSAPVPSQSQPGQQPQTSPTTTSTAGSVASTASSNSSYRSNHRLFPVSTYSAEPVNGTSVDYQQPHQFQQQQQAVPQSQQPPHHHHQSQQQQQQHSPQSQSQSQIQQQSSPQQQQLMPGIKFSSPQSHNWQSVADRISDFERQQKHLSGHHHHVMQQQQQQQQQQQLQSHPKYTYIDPSKTHRVPNPTLKAFQKNAVQSYFERQQHNAKENSKNYSTGSSPNISSRPQSLQLMGSPKEVPIPQMRSSLPNNYGNGQNISFKNGNPSAQKILNNSYIIPQISESDCGIPPPPPPRSRSLMPVRRSSSASEYADFREHLIHKKENQNISMEQLINTVSSPEKSSFNDCGMPPPPPPPRGKNSMPVRRTSSASDYAGFREKNIKAKQNLSKDLLGPIIMGPIISVDDWVPERPPKNPLLRIPSPDLPPPPMQGIDPDVNLLNQDEPLPPPPPEILTHIRQNSGSDGKPPSPSRRNSFAGSPSRKSLYRASTFENLSPPSVPKKPSPMELMQSRPSSSLAQSHKAHKVILNGKLESPITSGNHNHNHHHHSHMNGGGGHSAIIGQVQQLAQEQSPRTMSSNTTASAASIAGDARISAARKRAHNPQPPIQIENKLSPGKLTALIKSPPPLKPRMPIAGQEMRASSVAISSKLRCNSKASYLPRQSRDKLNATDPDHGSYKLTLTSNEDSINHNTTTTTPTGYHHDEILTTKCNNLPDVLPVGVKMQPSSPSSSGSSPRYGSNNNINSITPPHTAPAMMPTGYPMKSMFHFQPPTLNGQTRHNISPTSAYPPSYPLCGLSRSSMSPLNSSNDSISPKYMSQSTIDLKKTHVLETSDSSNSSKILSPAQSESNLNSCKDGKPQLSPFSARREFQKIEVVRKLSLEERDPAEGRIVRAELVNTTFSTSPNKSDEKMVIRKDSLRENIEKITQLQSKLMSAHFSENGGERKLLGYSAKTVEIKAKSLEMESPKLDRRPPPVPTSAPPPMTPTPIAIVSPSKQVTPAQSPTETERLSQMDIETDGLKLMQRTEIVLRLNAPTTEVASQTDESLEDELRNNKLNESKDEISRTEKRPPATLTKTVLHPRKKLPEEIDCDNLAVDLVSHLPPTDKLHSILAPKVYKCSSDYVSGFYNPNVAHRPAKRDIGTSTPCDKAVGCEIIKAASVEVVNSESEKPTIATDAINGKLATKYCRDVIIVNGDACDLTKKKEELVERLSKKLVVLGNEQTTIAEESSTNETLGSDLTAKIAQKVRPIDATKFRAYIDDVGHITMLLLSLSGRLARVENSLHQVGENHDDKKILEVKRTRLLEQLDEAKRLKEDIDRRGQNVGKILEKNLTIDEYADYDYFVNMKAKLIVDSREIADKIKLGEEQLNALRDTLVQSEC